MPDPQPNQPLDDDELFGILAEFDDPDTLRSAAEKVCGEGYVRVEAYTPYPVEGVSEALGMHRTRLPAVVLGGAILGGLTAFAMQYISSVWHYPLNIGGRPLFSWPMFIPIIFELSILGAALTAVFGMLTLNGLPRPYHPAFNIEEFALASSYRFFLMIIADDPKFVRQDAYKLLQNVGSRSVWEVPR